MLCWFVKLVLIWAKFGVPILSFVSFAHPSSQEKKLFNGFVDIFDSPTRRRTHKSLSPRANSSKVSFTLQPPSFPSLSHILFPSTDAGYIIHTVESDKPFLNGYFFFLFTPSARQIEAKVLRSLTTAVKPQSSAELAQRLFDPLSGVYLRDHKVWFRMEWLEVFC